MAKSWPSTEQGRAVVQPNANNAQDFARAAAEPPQKADVPVLYYAFDLLYLDGYDLPPRPVGRAASAKLASLLIAGDSVRYSDHYEKQGKALFEMAR